jgi:hypothetical protein
VRQAKPQPDPEPQPPTANDTDADLRAALSAARECVEHLTLRVRFDELALAQAEFAEAHLARRIRWPVDLPSSAPGNCVT